MIENPGKWLHQQAAARPEATALITPAEAISYAVLNSRVRHLAAHYLESGLAPGEPLALINKSRESLILHSGLAFYLDCPLLPLSPDQSSIGTMLEDCGILQVIADEGVALPANIKRFNIRFPDASAGLRPDTLKEPYSGHRFQLMIATSGTTGTPKVAVLSVHNIAASLRGSRERLGLAADDVWLNCLPVTHVGGFMIFLRCLESGATMRLHERFDPEQVRHAITESQCTHISLVPAMLAQLLDAGVKISADNRLRVALTGGGPLDEKLVKRAIDGGWPVCVAYGMTETASHICLNTGVTNDWMQDDAGTPIAGAEITTIDDAGHPASGIGHIRVSGPEVMAGYMQEGEIDRRAIEDGFLTGDLGYLDNKGHLHMTGRADDMLVSGGLNVHPAEVERWMQQCPGVREIGITAIPDSVWGDRLVACVAADTSLAKIEHWCREHLPGHLRPRTFRIVNALPRNATGKLDRVQLRQCVLDNTE